MPPGRRRLSSRAPRPRAPALTFHLYIIPRPCARARIPRQSRYVPHGHTAAVPTAPNPPFFRAAPEPGVIAGDKDPPRYEPSLRDLPPVGPPIRGCRLYPLYQPRTASTSGLLAYSRMDFYERRLRATLSAVYATRLSLNHSRTCRLSAASPFPRLRLLREDVGQPFRKTMAQIARDTLCANSRNFNTD